MPLVSATRMRLRSPIYLPLVFFHALTSARQVARSPGFLGGKLLSDRHLAFWTVTIWDEGAKMRCYRNSDAHRKAMPILGKICDEAGVAHWEQEDTTIPDWQMIHQQMLNAGRFTPLPHPSVNQQQGAIAPPVVVFPFSERVIRQQSQASQRVSQPDAIEL